MLYINLILFTLIFLLTCILVFLRWEKICEVYSSKTNFFDVLFIILYPFEELIFLFLYNFKKEFSNLWVSIILIAILFTLGIDKMLLRKQNEKAINLCLESHEESKHKQDELITKLYEKLKYREQEKIKLLNYIVELKNKLKKNRS